MTPHVWGLIIIGTVALALLGLEQRYNRMTNMPYMLIFMFILDFIFGG